MSLEAHEVMSDAYEAQRVYAGKWISAVAQLNPELTHIEGETYLCRLPNGYLKIGTSKQLQERMRKLKADLIAVVPGGETLELQAHYELRDYRIPCRGEVFFDHEAVHAWFAARQQLLVRQRRDEEVKLGQLHLLCTECGETKPANMFGRLRTAKRGFYTKCKLCRPGTHSAANVNTYLSRTSPPSDSRLEGQ